MISTRPISRKATTDACLQIDIRTLARDGLLKPGAEHRLSEHKSKYEVRLISDQDRIRFQYGIAMLAGFRRLGEDVVAIAWTECHYGGNRPWFLCPGCGRRVAILYGRKIASDGSKIPIRDRTLKCRQCHDLSYASQHEEWDRRMRRRAEKTWARVGGKYGTKPNRMRWRTYYRLVDEARYFEQLWLYG